VLYRQKQRQTEKSRKNCGCNNMEKIGKDEKLCKECGKVKHLTQFHRDKTTKDGFHWRCKVCKNDYNNEYARLKKQFEKMAEYHGISEYPKIKRGIETPDIQCDKCGHFYSPSIMFKYKGRERDERFKKGETYSDGSRPVIGYDDDKKDNMVICRQCVARNTDDDACSFIEPLPYMTNKELKEYEKQVALQEKKDKAATIQHWTSYLEDDGIKAGNIKDFDV